MFFYYRSRRVSRLGYQHDDVTLVGTKRAAFPSEVEIRFAGATVPRITSSRFVLWNAGNTTLHGSDIVENDPLRVELREAGTILKVTVSKTHRDVNALRVDVLTSVPASANIVFDFLDPRDGARFEVLHSGGPGQLR
ncbi:MAG TPA: hypothetical protein VIL06_08470, partial [Coriobacteriia bacterium]